MRIECTQHGCGQLLDVATPSHADLIAQPPDYETRRNEFAHKIGHAVTEALLAHIIFDCPTAAAADADCGATSPMGYRCNLLHDHGGKVHEHVIDATDDDGYPETRTVASWPMLTAVTDG